MKELRTIQAQLVAPKDQYNNFGKYKYRSAESILEALKPLLAKEKCVLTFSDDITAVMHRIYIKTVLTITNDKGEGLSVTAYAREDEQKKGMDSAQLSGSTSSYAHKYALNSLFLIDDTKDADHTNDHSSTPCNEPLVYIINASQQKRMMTLMTNAHKTPDDVKAILVRYGFSSSKKVTTDKYDAICAEIQGAS